MRGRDWFCQVLEGEPASLVNVFSTIQRDPRHTGIVSWHGEPISKPSFPDWAAGLAAGTGANPYLFLLRMKCSNTSLAEKCLLMREVSDVCFEVPELENAFPEENASTLSQLHPKVSEPDERLISHPVHPQSRP